MSNRFQYSETLIPLTINVPTVDGGCYQYKREEAETMSKFEGKKHYLHGMSATRFETRAEAEASAKKYMESYARSGLNDDVVVYEAVATVKFPLPAYEVVDLAKA